MGRHYLILFLQKISNIIIMESLQIYLHSRNADKLNNNNISDAEYLLPPIEIPDGNHIYLSVVNVTIPYSFYNINDINNLLSYNLITNGYPSIFVNYVTDSSINFFFTGDYDYYTYRLDDDNANILYNNDIQLTDNTLLISNLKKSMLYQLTINFYRDGYEINVSIYQSTNEVGKTIIKELPPQFRFNLKLINGNYNITQLVNYLSSIMIGFTIIYNEITNKLTFSHITNNFTFSYISTCLNTIGFQKRIKSVSELMSLTSINCVNIMSVKRINIASNLITYNIDKSNINNQSILCSIPVNKPPYSLIEYINTNNFRTNLFINLINLITIKLIDEYGNLIDMNGNNYCITLQIDVEAFK